MIFMLIVVMVNVKAPQIRSYLKTYFLERGVQQVVALGPCSKQHWWPGTFPSVCCLLDSTSHAAHAAQSEGGLVGE
jgi:hypothetical protein